MNPEKLRIAIAEKCGWTPRQVVDRKSGEMWTCWDREGQTASIKTGMLPNYPADLSAMHEAEKTLTDEQWGDYCSMLEFVLGVDEKSKRTRKIKVLHATAPQRAVAFARVFNIWEDE